MSKKILIFGQKQTYSSARDFAVQNSEFTYTYVESMLDARRAIEENGRDIVAAILHQGVSEYPGSATSQPNPNLSKFEAELKEAHVLPVRVPINYGLTDLEEAQREIESQLCSFS